MNNPNDHDHVPRERNAMKNPGQQQSGGQSMPGAGASQQQGGVLKHAAQGQGSSPNPDPRNNAGQKHQAQQGQRNKSANDSIEQKGADKTADKGEGDQ